MPPPGFDLTDPERNLLGVPHDELAALRRHAPVHWVEQPQSARDGFEGGTGYWAVSRHADVSAVSRNSTDFSTAENSAIIRFAAGTTRENIELQRAMLINQDPPDHSATRRIVSRAFTPRSIDRLRETMTERASAIVRDAAGRDAGDFVTEVAADLPLQAIADLLGVPQADRSMLFDWSNRMLSYEDQDGADDAQVAAAELVGYAMAMAADRRSHPRDDVVTQLVEARLDGRGLTDDEFAYFFIILGVAGNETTRNALTHGMLAFFDHPDQWDLFRRERPATTVDEVLRWSTPVMAFQRTALRDVEVGAQTVRRGQRVGLLYASANFDDDVFDAPFAFDITRDPNPHVTFGGHGVHYCIGANLARLEIAVMLDAIAEHLPDIHRLGEVHRLRHSWMNAVREVQVGYRS